MNKFKEESGKESMIRRITWLIIIVALSWGTMELIANYIFSKYEIEFDVHEELILTTLGIGITGKVGQKIVERKKNKENEIEST